jgi:hypothetical protein
VLWLKGKQSVETGQTHPSSLEKLSEHQHSDGSWGSKISYVHDRLLSTLAVVLLLNRFGRRNHDDKQRLAGERYIWQHIGQLHYDAHRTIALEMLLPSLLAEKPFYDVG